MSLLHSSKLLRDSSAYCYIWHSGFLNHVAKGIPQSFVVLTLTKDTWSQPFMAAVPGFKSQRQSSSAAPSLTPSTISYTCQHSHIFPAFLGCHSKSRQVWPHGVEPIISKLSRRLCNQGKLPPSYIGSKSLPSPWLKAWPLFNVSMKPVIKRTDKRNDHA